MDIIGFGMVSLHCWALFIFAFSKDRSRYRNCYFLFIALISVVPFLISLSGPYMNTVAVIIINAVLLILLIVPFFLIYNGIVMIKREGRHLSQLLSLALGGMILLGEAAFFLALFRPYFTEGAIDPSLWFLVCMMVSVTVIYGSLSFLIFMLYTLFLQIIPRKKDFDYVIIHGAGLLDGQRVSKLLRDRLDKAIEVYRKDPTPPKLIPSGGQGSDEKISEAEAMKSYLMDQGIPENDIILEDASTTTYENLLNSKKIMDIKEIQERLSEIGRQEATEEYITMDGMIMSKHVSAKEALKAMELLGKMQGAFLDRSQVELSGAIPVVIRDDI